MSESTSAPKSSFHVMVMEALTSSEDKNGVSFIGIKNFVSRKYPEVADRPSLKYYLKKCLLKALEKGEIQRPKRNGECTGVTGKFKMAMKPKTIKKPKIGPNKAENPASLSDKDLIKGAKVSKPKSFKASPKVAKTKSSGSGKSQSKSPSKSSGKPKAKVALGSDAPKSKKVSAAKKSKVFSPNAKPKAKAMSKKIKTA